MADAICAEKLKLASYVSTSQPASQTSPRTVSMNPGASGSGRDCAFAVPGRDQAQDRAVGAYFGRIS